MTSQNASMLNKHANQRNAGTSLTLAASAVFRYRLLLCAAYPLMMAIAVRAEMPWLEAALLPLAATVIMAPLLARGQRAAWLGLLVLAALAIAVRSQPWLSMWPPAVVTACMAAWFGATLRPGSVPLIARFAENVLRSCGIQGVSGDDSTRWMRAWTAVWALMLGGFAVALAWVAWQGDVAGWVGLTYALPVLIATLLCGEYGLRRIFLPQHAQMSLVAFLAALLATDWADLAR